MIKIRLHGTRKEVEIFKAYIETLSPRVEVTHSTSSYNDRRKGKKRYRYNDPEEPVYSYLDIQLKPLNDSEQPSSTKAKSAEEIRQLVKEKFPKVYEDLQLWSVFWADIDSVLDYLYEVTFRNPKIQPELKEIVEFIEEQAEL